MLLIGGGKSLLFIVPAYLNNAGTIVIVVPYRALINDLVRRIRDSRINYIKWKHGEENLAAVVVVSVDVVGEPDFLKYVMLLSGKKLL